MVFLLFLFCMEPFHFPGKGLICPEFPEKDQGINTGNAHNVTKSGTIIPVADFDNLQEVLVITQLKNGDGGDNNAEAAD